MANQGFAQSLNLLEVPDGAELIQNLAGGTVDADLRLFSGLSSRRSQLFWDRFYNTVSVEKSPSALTQATQFQWQTDYIYTDDDIVSVTPINLIKDLAASFNGFDSDGKLINNLGGIDIAFDRGEGYTPGTYNLNLQGGSGQNATAEIVVDGNGLVESVEVTNSGTGYAYGDTFTAAIPGNGVGFNVRIVSFPWKVVLVGNFAWDVANLSNKQLSVKIANTSDALNGDYDIKIPNTGVNVWYLPNDASNPAYDVNRKIYADTKIANNASLFDVNGDGTLTTQDVGLINIWYTAISNPGASSPATIISELDSYYTNNPPLNGSIRDTGTKVYNYLSGLDPSLWDLDGTGLTSSLKNNTYFTNYVNGGNYIFASASTLIDQTPVATSSTTKHAVAIEFRAKQDPKYILPVDLVEQYERPYFSLHYTSSGSKVNAFDNFLLYGAEQTCTTNQIDWINNVQVGSYNSTYDYRIVSKYSISDENGNITYYVQIVTSGSGKPINIPFGNSPTLTPTNSSPVFDSAIEYGVYDSNSSNTFFLRTDPRSTNENVKQIVTFSEKYVINDSSSGFNGQSVNVISLIPDIILQRDDSLTTENIENLEAPIIVDDGTANAFVGIGGSFSYNIRGYSEEIANVINNVDESIYLRSTKYRIDRNLYYQKEIVVDGFMSSFDPDEFNLTSTDLLEDLSPGIYISSASSQITNPLASDFANKTRSFSSDYNPWKLPTEVGGQPNSLTTKSLAVSINDLVWTTEIKLNVGTYIKQVTPASTLDDNFNATTVAAGESFKLKMLVNGEEYFIIMRKT